MLVTGLSRFIGQASESFICEASFISEAGIGEIEEVRVCRSGIRGAGDLVACGICPIVRTDCRIVFQIAGL